MAVLSSAKNPLLLCLLLAVTGFAHVQQNTLKLQQNYVVLFDCSSVAIMQPMQ